MSASRGRSFVSDMRASETGTDGPAMLRKAPSGRSVGTQDGGGGLRVEVGRRGGGGRSRGSSTVMSGSTLGGASATGRSRMHVARTRAANPVLSAFDFEAVGTLAGVGKPGYRDGPLARSYFDEPTDLCALPDGSFLVTDVRNNCIRRVVLSTRKGGAASSVTTLDTNTFLNPLSPICVQNGEAILIADSGHHKIRMLRFKAEEMEEDELGIMRSKKTVLRTWIDDSIVAGSGRRGCVDGAAESAQFSNPSGLLALPDGSFLVSDTGNHCIRRISRRGAGRRGLIVRTVAGAPPSVTDGKERAGFGDGIGPDVRFRKPMQLALDHFGRVLVADSGNHCIRALRVSVEGNFGAPWVVTTVIGDGTRGFADGPAKFARLDSPRTLSTAPDGTVYFTDANDAVRCLVFRRGSSSSSSEGGREYVDVLTLAGLRPSHAPPRRPTGGERRGEGEGGDGEERYVDGLLHDARFLNPRGICHPRGMYGVIVVADQSNHFLRAVLPRSVILAPPHGLSAIIPMGLRSSVLTQTIPGGVPPDVDARNTDPRAVVGPGGELPEHWTTGHHRVGAGVTGKGQKESMAVYDDGDVLSPVKLSARAMPLSHRLIKSPAQRHKLERELHAISGAERLAWEHREMLRKEANAATTIEDRRRLERLYQSLTPGIVSDTTGAGIVVTEVLPTGYVETAAQTGERGSGKRREGGVLERAGDPPTPAAGALLSSRGSSRRSPDSIPTQQDYGKGAMKRASSVRTFALDGSTVAGAPLDDHEVKVDDSPPPPRQSPGAIRRERIRRSVSWVDQEATAVEDEEELETELLEEMEEERRRERIAREGGHYVGSESGEANTKSTSRRLSMMHSVVDMAKGAGREKLASQLRERQRADVRHTLKTSPAPPQPTLASPDSFRGDVEASSRRRRSEFEEDEVDTLRQLAAFAAAGRDIARLRKLAKKARETAAGRKVLEARAAMAAREKKRRQRAARQGLSDEALLQQDRVDHSTAAAMAIASRSSDKPRFMKHTAASVGRARASGVRVPIDATDADWRARHRELVGWLVEAEREAAAAAEKGSMLEDEDGKVDGEDGKSGATIHRTSTFAKVEMGDGVVSLQPVERPLSRSMLAEGESRAEQRRRVLQESGPGGARSGSSNPRRFMRRDAKGRPHIDYEAEEDRPKLVRGISHHILVSLEARERAKYDPDGAVLPVPGEVKGHKPFHTAPGGGHIPAKEALAPAPYTRDSHAIIQAFHPSFHAESGGDVRHVDALPAYGIPTVPTTALPYDDEIIPVPTKPIPSYPPLDPPKVEVVADEGGGASADDWFNTSGPVLRRRLAERQRRINEIARERARRRMARDPDASLPEAIPLNETQAARIEAMRVMARIAEADKKASEARKAGGRLESPPDSPHGK